MRLDFLDQIATASQFGLHRILRALDLVGYIGDLLQPVQFDWPAIRAIAIAGAAAGTGQKLPAESDARPRRAPARHHAGSA